MDYEERLKTLLHIFAELSEKVAKELEGNNNAEKIKEYNRQMQQIDDEVKRIEKMRSYK